MFLIYESIIHDKKSFVNTFFDFFSYFFKFFFILFDYKSFFLYNIVRKNKGKTIMVDKEKHILIGQRIKKLRELKNIEQSELAEMLGYKSQSTISKWESGVNLPTGKKLIALAKIFNTSTNDILGIEKPVKEEYTTSDLREMAENAKTFDGKPLNEDDIQAIQNIIEIYLKGRQ